MNDLSIPPSDHKVYRYGCSKRALYLLEVNYTNEQIAKQLTDLLNDPDKVFTPDDIQAWFLSLPEEIQSDVKQKQWKKLCAAVHGMERQAIHIRKTAMERMEKIIATKIDSMKGMETKELNELAKIIMKPIYIQESAERLAGVGNRERNYGDINIHVDVGVMERMKELTKNKDKFIDVEYTDVKDKKKDGKGGGKGGAGDDGDDD